MMLINWKTKDIFNNWLTIAYLRTYKENFAASKNHLISFWIPKFYIISP